MPNQTLKSRYGEALGELLAEPRVMPLDAGRPHGAVRDRLADLTPKKAFDGREVVDEQMAEATLAGVWLLHDFLEESHEISQSIHTPTGSYWHAIMHRREPDYPNSKHWFRQTGSHPIFPDLNREAAELTEAHDAYSQASFLTSQAQWEPFTFVDLCKAALKQRGPLEELCQQIQMREWWLLFDFCYQRAIGEG